jgi:hypothetical protein
MPFFGVCISPVVLANAGSVYCSLSQSSSSSSEWVDDHERLGAVYLASVAQHVPTDGELHPLIMEYMSQLPAYSDVRYGKKCCWATDLKKLGEQK